MCASTDAGFVLVSILKLNHNSGMISFDPPVLKRTDFLISSNTCMKEKSLKKKQLPHGIKNKW